MKISLNWLSQYIPFDISHEELANRLTMVGFEVESIEKIDPPFEGIVVGEVIHVESIPKSDVLKSCKVNTGKETFTAVCGAPNVQIGQLVPFAKVGARLSDQTFIESRTIKGFNSAGMICSEKELGLGENHSGILVLDKTKYKVGSPFVTESSMGDIVLELNVTPNRPDCLCHLGIAREIGVILGKKAVFPENLISETNDAIEGKVRIRIMDAIKCPRYSARLIDDIQMGPSPKWMVDRLEAVGMRSINNIIDITNFVMLETGQPLHAFDFDLIAGREIIVRSAVNNEAFVTLDKQKHLLTSDDLLICDGEKGVALAGIMGGLNSEVSNQTRTVLLESAHFHPTTIRKTSKRLGIASEASLRFERGTDPGMTGYAVDRAAQLFAEIAYGKIAHGVIDIYPDPKNMSEIILEKSKLSLLLGIDIPDKNIISILSGLGFESKAKNPFRILVPTFRNDIRRDVDLIEEVIRHYGYDKIKPKSTSEIVLSEKLNFELELCETIKDFLSGFGFYEVINNSLVSPKHATAISAGRIPVAIQNPLSPENALLRTNLLSGILDSVAWNKNRSEPNQKLFEIGWTFASNEEILPDEKLLLAGSITGLKNCQSFWNEKSRPVNFYDLKGLIQAFLDRLNLAQYSFFPADITGMTSETGMVIYSQNTQLGFMGELENALLRQWDIDVPIFGFEMDIHQLLQVLPKVNKYKPIPRYPAIQRDLAFLVDESIPVGDLQKAIFNSGGDFLRNVEIFDLYRGHQISAGKKSVAFSLEFYSMERTLKETEVEPIIKFIVEHMEKQFSANLRA